MQKEDILPDGSRRQYDTGYAEIKRPIDFLSFFMDLEDVGTIQSTEEAESVEPMSVTLDEQHYFLNGYWFKFESNRLKQMVKVALFCSERPFFIVEELQDSKKIEEWIKRHTKNEQKEKGKKPC